MLGSRQADGPDVVWVGDRTVQLHQGDVIVKGVLIVVWVRYDLLQVFLHHCTSNLPLDVKAEVSFPSAGVGESEDTRQNISRSSFSISDNKHITQHKHHFKYVWKTRLRPCLLLHLNEWSRVCDDSDCTQGEIILYKHSWKTIITVLMKSLTVKSCQRKCQEVIYDSSIFCLLWKERDMI